MRLLVAASALPSVLCAFDQEDSKPDSEAFAVRLRVRLGRAGVGGSFIGEVLRGDWETGRGREEQHAMGSGWWAIAYHCYMFSTGISTFDAT